MPSGYKIHYTAPSSVPASTDIIQLFGDDAHEGSAEVPGVPAGSNRNDLFTLGKTIVIEIIDDCPPGFTVAETFLLPWPDPNTLGTYGGVHARYAVNPGDDDWDGVVVKEVISLNTSLTDCEEGTHLVQGKTPQSICNGEGSFTIGAGTLDLWPYGPLPASGPVHNSFWDTHFAASNRSYLKEGAEECDVVCNQDLWCGGSVVGAFRIIKHLKLEGEQTHVVITIETDD